MGKRRCVYFGIFRTIAIILTIRSYQVVTKREISGLQFTQGLSFVRIARDLDRIALGVRGAPKTAIG